MARNPHTVVPAEVPSAEELQRKLTALLGEARRNENTLRKFQALEIELLGAESMTELLRVLLRDTRAGFAWDVVALSILDPRREIQRLLETSGIRPRADFPELVLLDDGVVLEDVYGERPVPLLGAYESRRLASLFPRNIASPASVAVLPLVRKRVLFGSFNLASYSPRRFPAEAATDFLEHLAAVVSVCVEAMLARERLQHVGLTDALTGLNNRRFFDQRLGEEVARARRHGVPVSCVCVDIDHFKRINDAYGHAVGDAALRQVAHRIREHSRNIDVVTRYGGEEFCMLLTDTVQQAAVEVAERIRQTVAEKPFQVGSGREERLTVSAGVATLDPAAEGDARALGAALVDQADQALLAAKRGGRNQVRIPVS